MTDLNKALANVRANKPITGAPEFLLSVALACMYEHRQFVGPESGSPKTTATNILKLSEHIGANKNEVSAYWIACRMATYGMPNPTVKVNTNYDDILNRVLHVSENNGEKITSHLITGKAKLADYEETARIIHIRKFDEKKLFPSVQSMIRYDIGEYCVEVYQKSTINDKVIDVKNIAEIAESIPLLDGIKVKKATSSIEYEDVEYVIEDRKPGAILSSVYSEYIPDRVTVIGGKKHPADLVESRTVAALTGPRFDTKVKLPKGAIENGSISAVQAEAIVMCCAAHERHMKSGERMGFFIADSTGVGKTNEQTGIIAHNIANGRLRNIYFTETERHIVNVRKSLKMIGLPQSLIISLSDYNRYDELPNRDGIIYATYTQLGQMDDNDDYVRVNQIQKWLGSNFEGTITFDESHNLANAISLQTGQFGYGTSDPSNQSRAALMLKASNPEARVIYCSATGLSKAENIAYLTRLNIWGENNTYTTPEEIIAGITQKGLSALEVLNTHLVSSGLAISRSLSLKNVEYTPLLHMMTADDINLWNNVTNILGQIRKIMDVAFKEALNDHKSKKPSKNASGYYEGSCRRIIEMLMMTIKTPSLIKSISHNIEKGEAAIVQLMNTYESVSADHGETLRKSILSIIEKCLPKYRIKAEKNASLTFTYLLDKNDQKIKTKVFDEIERIEMLVKDIQDIDNPIDKIINHFGRDHVAEITGRTTRKILVDGKPVEERRGQNDVSADHVAYMSDRKRILVFSTGAGGSSMDYHASMDVNNQRKRNHYIMQYGYKATQALQGIGRSHRAFQAQPPHLWLVTTDLPSERIYRSQIINRIRNVGAINHGNRNASSQSFSNADNYNSSTASAAINIFTQKVMKNSYPQLTAEMFKEVTHLSGEMFNNISAMTQHRLLSRIARCNTDNQDLIMNLIDKEIEMVIENKIEDRSFDSGPEYIEGKFEKKEIQVLFESKESGSKITATNISGDIKIKIQDFRTAYKEAENYEISGLPPEILFDPTTGRISIVATIEKPTFMNDGTYRIVEPHSSRNSSVKTNMSDGNASVFSVKRISSKEAEPLWASYAHEISKKFESDNTIISGSIMAAPTFFFRMDLKPIVIEYKDKTLQFGLLTKQNNIDEIKNLIELDQQEIIANTLIVSCIEDLEQGKYLVTQSNGILFLRTKAKNQNVLEYVPHVSLIGDMILKSSLYGLQPIRENGQTKFIVNQIAMNSSLRKLLSSRSGAIKEILDKPDWTITTR